MYQKFHEAGFCVIPSDKIPLVSWACYQKEKPALETVQSWNEKFIGKNYELVCGEVSGVIGIDIDTDDFAIILQVEAIAGVSPVKKFGTKGFTAFYRYNGEASNCWKKDGKVVFELLSNKRLCCLPPSNHRHTGKPYIWLGAELIGAELPALGTRFVEVMDVLFPKPQYIQHEHHEYHESVNLDIASGMLQFINTDCSRDEWIKIGMALRSEFGDAATELWHQWSSQGKTYNQREAHTVWRSFNGSGVGIGTLIFIAKQGGWLPPAFISNDTQMICKEEVPAVIKTPSVGGLVGEIANWITETAIKPQPQLSLAASLSFVSMLKGHRVCGMTNLHPNLYTMSLAKTGTGKEHPFNCITWLANALKIREKIMGVPASGSGAATGLKKTGGAGLLPIDEFGRFLAGVSGKNAQSFQTEIIDFLISIYSKSGSTYIGKQYANDKENPQMILENPYLAIAGCTVKNKFTEACNNSVVIDGFLNRWLIFETTDNPEELYSQNIGCVPDDLLAKIREWLARNNGDIKKIGFTSEAFKTFMEYKKSVSKKQAEAEYPFDALYSRLGGQVEKVCLTLCDEGSIDCNILAVAIAIVDASHLKALEFSKGIANNQHEADLLYVLEIIKRNKKLSKNQLTRQTQKLNQKTRNEILSQLLESGQIASEPSSNNTIMITYSL